MISRQTNFSKVQLRTNNARKIDDRNEMKVDANAAGLCFMTPTLEKNMESSVIDPSSMLSCLSNYYYYGDPEDVINEILNNKQDPIYLCLNCDELSKATSRCKNCNELLCNNCVRAHIRVKLTKDHCIVPLEESYLTSTSSSASYSSSNATSQSSPNSMLNGNYCLTCDLHIKEVAKTYCDSCNLLFCPECELTEHKSHSCLNIHEAIDRARTSSIKLLTDAKMSAQSAKDCIDLSQRMLETINLRTQSLTRDINNIMRRFQKAVEERERELISTLERIRLIKYKAVQHQIEGYKTLFSYFNQSSKTISDALEAGNGAELIIANDSISNEMKRLRSIRANMPLVDDYISIIPPDYSLLFAVSSMAEITTTGFTQGTIEEMVGCCDKYSLPNRNPPYLGDLSNIVNSLSMISCQDKPFNEASKFPLYPSGNYKSKDFSNQFLQLPPRVRNTVGSTRRDYTMVGDPVLVIGGEGEQDGQLCRPWGVCCTAEGKIIVADRSNNRIQIFKADGSFLHKFGSHGSEPGFFDRPAGVAVDPHGRIIVADKDNHRLQVFTQEGKFIFTFGEKGSKLGQFNYPWDIAVDSKGRIVVSDTRNHRIQLFDNDGSFLAKYGFENSTNMVKHFDSPRGVCFGAKGCVIVTDFNNHRLVVIDSNFRNAKFLGYEGCGEKQFLRPQGIAVDPAGNIVVADSRNNRIQIYEQNGGLIHKFGSPGKEPGQMDRPSGICLSPDGKIIVVDFGNNRVQVF